MKMFSFGQVKIDPQAYGSQGSAVLGIRDSGKSYTATALAEKLFEAGIPFIAFDPIGLWRFMRIPGSGKGYPIVVAGGQEGDLPLTVTGAPEIVRAAMHNGVSLVIDLYDINLSKADWKRIVTACVKVLLHENGKHGLRHIFLEEAAEFAPQRVGPEAGQVYAEIEKLARMGGNARLGYTLINQRAEEVNKAVLELCDNLFLHRQKGRNSLTALSKWLDVGNVKDHKKIIESISTLDTGKCWAWMAGQEEAHLVSVPKKNSYHPDRRVMRGDKDIKQKSAVDVGSFITSMKESLVEVEEEAAANDPIKLKRRISELERELQKKAGTGAADMKSIEAAREAGYRQGKIDGYGEGMTETTKHLHEKMRETFDKFMEKEAQANAVIKHWKKRSDRPAQNVLPPLTPTSLPKGELKITSPDDLTGPQRRILESLAFWKSVGHDQPTRAQVAVVAGYSPNGSAFKSPLAGLSSSGLVSYPSTGLIQLTGYKTDSYMTVDQAREHILSVLTGPQRKIIESSDWFAPVDKEQLAGNANYSADGSAFKSPLAGLCSLKILYRPSKGVLAMSDWAKEIL